MNLIETLDREILIFLNQLGTPAYDQFWLSITRFTTWIPLLIFCIAFFFYRLKLKTFGILFLCSVLNVATVLGLMFWSKPFFKRLRPVNDPELNEFLRVLIKPTDYSFFSGHAASSVAIALFTWYYFNKLNFKYGLLVFVWPALFAYSRLYLGVHYPTDIFMGALVGVLSACFYIALINRFFFGVNSDHHEQAV